MVLKPMLAKNGKCSDAKDEDKIKQIKYDGTRTFVLKDDDKVRLMGARNWKNDYAKQHPELAAEVRKIPVKQTVLDCELTYFKKGTEKDVFLTALATKKTIEKEGVEPKLMCFDILKLNNANVQKLPYEERDKLLEHTIPKNLDLLKKVESTKDGEKLLDDSRKNEAEGIIVKDPDCIYQQDVRSKCWLKVKNWLSDEAVVVGYTQGKGAKAPTFGAVVLAQYDKDKLQYVGKAAGFTNAESETMLKKMNKIKSDEPTAINVQGEVKEWVKPKMVVEVKYLQRTPHGVLRQPDFMRERTDKKPSEVTLKTGRGKPCGL